MKIKAKPKQKQKKYTYTCNQCGSEDVKLDAWAVWDVKTQDWVLENTFDEAYCPDCDGSCNIDQVPVK